MRSEPGVQAVRLDREVILEAAARIVGTEGVRALTMRRIGAELGADPTAVYRHFHNKEALLTHLAVRLFCTEPELDPRDSWQDRLRSLIRHAFERYRAHPDLGILLARQPDDIPPLVRTRELTLDVLVNGAGLDLQAAAMMSHLLENHIVGCGLFFAVSEYAGDPRVSDAAALRRAYALLGDDVAPLAGAAAPYLFPDPIITFEATTELLIAAIEREGRQHPRLTNTPSEEGSA
ncbi:MAG: TetR/AcrR family transcriptional regulator [Solirubrobacteraceae bacterium]